MNKKLETNKMDNNVDKCSAVKCTAPPTPPPNQIPQRRKKSVMFLSVSVCLSASVERFAVSRMRDFLSKFSKILGHRLAFTEKSFPLNVDVNTN